MFIVLVFSTFHTNAHNITIIPLLSRFSM